MSDDERPEDGEQPADAPTQLSDWDTNNQTEAYATGEAPDAPVSAFRSVALPGADGGTGPSGFEQTATNQTQQYGAPAPAAPAAPSAPAAPQPVARQLRSTLTELDDVMPPGSSAWDLPANRTQQYGGPGPVDRPADAPSGASVPAGGGWSDGSNRTQVYGTGAQRPVSEVETPADGHGRPGDAWSDAGNHTQRYSPAPAPAGAAAPSGGEWDAETNRTQQYAAPSPAQGRSLAPPREESNDPWGSPDNNTAFYAHGIAQPTYPPPPNASERVGETEGGRTEGTRPEGTEPNPPAPRSGTEPYGQPISSASQELAEDSGPRPANLEEAARRATDEVNANRPSPRGDLPVFVEIGELDEEAETLDTEATPADGPMHPAKVREEHFVPRGRVPTVGGAADSGSWEMSPPAGVNKADTSGPHIPKVTDPGSFELEPPTTKPGD